MSEPRTPSSPAPFTAELLDCRLTVRVGEIGPQRLVLTYTFENGSDRDAYLFNRAVDGIDRNGVYTIEPNRVSIEIGQERVTIGKKIVAVPPFTLVEKRDIPSVTKVAPGTAFKETLEVPIPLVVTTPYTEPYDAKPDDSVKYPVDFELGFFLGTTGTDSLARTVESNLGPIVRFDPFPIDSQQILRVPSIAEGVASVPPPGGSD